MNFRCQKCGVLLTANELDVGSQAKCPGCEEVTDIVLPPGSEGTGVFTNGRALACFLFALFALINGAMAPFLIAVRPELLDAVALRYALYGLLGATSLGVAFSLITGFSAFRVIILRGPKETGRAYALWGLFSSAVLAITLVYLSFKPQVDSFARSGFERAHSIMGEPEEEEGE
jgi:phage FluMu protein Com